MFKQNDQRQEKNIVGFLIYFTMYWITFDMQESHVWLTWGNNSIKSGLMFFFFVFFKVFWVTQGLSPFIKWETDQTIHSVEMYLKRIFSWQLAPAVSFALCAVPPAFIPICCFVSTLMWMQQNSSASSYWTFISIRPQAHGKQCEEMKPGRMRLCSGRHVIRSCLY